MHLARRDRAGSALRLARRCLRHRLVAAPCPAHSRHCRLLPSTSDQGVNGFQKICLTKKRLRSTPSPKGGASGRLQSPARALKNPPLHGGNDMRRRPPSGRKYRVDICSLDSTEYIPRTAATGRAMSRQFNKSPQNSTGRRPEGPKRTNSPTSLPNFDVAESGDAELWLRRGDVINAESDSAISCRSETTESAGPALRSR